MSMGIRKLLGSRIVSVSAWAAFVLGIALWPQTVLALPTLAQAYHVDCSACHSFVPALNAYGRYIQSTAFGRPETRPCHQSGGEERFMRKKRRRGSCSRRGKLGRRIPDPYTSSAIPGRRRTRSFSPNTVPLPPGQSDSMAQYRAWLEGLRSVPVGSVVH